MSVVPQLNNGEQKVFFQAGGEWCYIWTPESFQKDKSNPVVIHHHGATGYVKNGSADWLEEDQKVAYLRAVMAESGCAIAGSHACGDHWGNQKAVTANHALFEALDECAPINTDRTGLMGGGLGGALIWNSVLGPLAGKVKAVAVMQAVVNLEAVIREQKFKIHCLKAYDIPEDTPDDQAVAKIHNNNPLQRLQRLAIGTPLPKTAIYHGAIDANIIPETNAIPLAEALKRAGGEVILELFPEVGHAVYEMGKPIEERLNAFFEIAF